MPVFPQRQIRAVVQGAHHPAFRVGQRLLGRKLQTSLDLGSLQDLRVFAAHDIRQSCQISEDGSRPILPVQAEQGTRFGVVVRFERPLDGCYCLTQLCSVFSIPGISQSVPSH